MEERYLIKAHHIPAYEADVKKLWRPTAAFLCMQEMAGDHSELLGFDRETLLNNHGVVWMLARTHLRLPVYPRQYDEISIKTWPGAPSRATFPRYYEFTGPDGQALGAGATSWMLVDVAKRRIVPPARLNLRFPDTGALTPPMPEPQRFRLSGENLVRETVRKPEYADIDLNGHMNNASYINWITDLFPIARHETGRITDLIISYAAEAVTGKNVAMRLYETGSAFEVLGVDEMDGHTIFEAKGIWEELK